MNPPAPPSGPSPSFKGRSLARSYGVQALYEWAISGNALADIESRTLNELSLDKRNTIDTAYFHALLFEVPQKIEQIESTFSPYLTDRAVQDLDMIERTILRLSTYELLEQLDVPYAVVLNEAIILGKRFGGADSYKFINGILDKVAKKVRPHG